MTTASPERDLLTRLRGAHRLDDLYGFAREAGILDRDGGDVVIHGKNDTVGKRRLRGALQNLKRADGAKPLGDTRWLLGGEPEKPRRIILISLAGPRREVELRLEAAAALLARFDGDVDLVFTDPPWGLGRRPDHGGGSWDWAAESYGRGHERQALTVPGYVDVDPDDYPAFTKEWVTSAAGALRPGGHLVVVTGPQQAARVQVCAEDAGLTFVNQITAEKWFALRSLRRFAQAHWTITVMCRGKVTSKLRTFNPPADMLSKSGNLYPRDFWPAHLVGRADARPGEIRYANALPEMLVDRVLDAFTRPPTLEEIAEEPDLTVDPFNGGGTIATRAALRGLRVLAGDVNPGSLAFTADRLDRALTGAHS